MAFSTVKACKRKPFGRRRRLVAVTGGVMLVVVVVGVERLGRWESNGAVLRCAVVSVVELLVIR